VRCTVQNTVAGALLCAAVMVAVVLARRGAGRVVATALASS
jgi:hypothetical protein